MFSYKCFTLQERLEREYNLSLITTAPSVVYRVNCEDGDIVIFSTLNSFHFGYILLVSMFKRYKNRSSKVCLKK